jgi:hypothetical protein
LKELMRRLVPVLALGAALLLAAGAQGAGRVAQLSDNWTGYAATGTAFRSVSGAWVQPGGNCLTRATNWTEASFWVGLGGALESSNAIEQIGTDADCTPSGRLDAYAWYELYPAPSHTIGLRISPGDRMWASVVVRGTRVTVRIVDRTTSRSFTHTFPFRKASVSSAEWIAEAPAITFRHTDQVQPMTNFGQVTFSDARAVATDGHAGAIADPAWHEQPQELETWLAHDHSSIGKYLAVAAGAHIVPSALANGGTSFVARYERRLPSLLKPGQANVA